MTLVSSWCFVPLTFSFLSFCCRIKYHLFIHFHTFSFVLASTCQTGVFRLPLSSPSHAVSPLSLHIFARRVL
ncbi:uncharacterized protein LACBIDRAFT_314171 [Laccaria bicolor S238N-H82]|uniref:Predicted protein n=1 Tax=Laccaria bicolor (strain S238N-H82 / ATCC MYA-4686) TaxID=486041 RepID=B0D1R5_LACBS|nr:uncharacterized protein LACBIDRAFT_314171 [Laccaria bicolor S238N-H82]EDR11686.1 predicted protein [Laccaria bicolor S238N-H82]|eukprot:XP_001877583.1 predicted protein [Laccaria bicolor S238N-H82]